MPAPHAGLPRTIAMDGPAAAGKTTVARRLAELTGHISLDTGAIYRALTVAALDRGVNVEDGKALAALARTTPITVEPSADNGNKTGYIVRVDGADVTLRLRDGEVDANVSEVSKHAAVRDALLTTQRRVAASAPTLMVGRDIGTVVLPDADMKIYLDATPEERARRRYRERLARGEAARWNEVIEAMHARDALDSSRDVAPLRPADQAVVVLTDGCDFDQVVAHLMALIERWPGGLTSQGGHVPCSNAQ